MGLDALTRICAVFALCGTTTTWAEDLDPDPWQFGATPYLWAVSLEGEAAVGGIESDVDFSFGDVAERLNFAFMGRFDARKRDFGFYLDTVYSDLEDEADIGALDLELGFEMVIVEFGGFYRVGEWRIGEVVEGQPARLTLEGLAGGRYTNLKSELDIDPGPSASARKDWVDPIVGARTVIGFTEDIDFLLEGTVGGFGVGSDFTWGTLAVLGYRFGLFGEDDATLRAGYKVLDQDFDDGSFEWDVTLHGPILGLSVRF